MLKFENPSFPNSVVGYSHDDRLIYDYNLMVKDLMEQDDMNEDEAMEFIDYNTLRSIPYYEGAPIVLYPSTLEEIEEWIDT